MSAVTYEVARPHIAVVTIQRPEACNAVNSAVAQALDQAVKRVEADPEVWAAVLTGAGGVAFSSGADLKEVSQGQMNSLYTADGAFAGFVRHPRSKLWIAAVDGLALAGGFEIALACDLIIASENSAFALPEVTRGLVAAAGGAYRLVRALPRAIAMELLATGDRLTAARAKEFGLVSRLTAPGDALNGALDLATEICANAPLAVRETLQIARAAQDHDDTTLFQLGLEAQARLMVTQDFQEGPRAFIEKRAPVWKGC